MNNNEDEYACQINSQMLKIINISNILNLKCDKKVFMKKLLFDLIKKINILNLIRKKWIYPLLNKGEIYIDFNDYPNDKNSNIEKK